ncbi:MAG: hypothetical protein F6K24_04440 [Okeania sp. SIO2D1]|nr:hypothetical protein [Okeania sp. SIO2D1]
MESLFAGEGDRRQPTPNPSQEGKTGDNPPLTPPRRGGEDRRNGLGVRR